MSDSSAEPKTPPVRRVVTGHDPAGKAVVIMDGDSPHARYRASSGVVSNLLWVNDQTPASNAGDDDCGAREIGTAPPPGGAIFRTVDFPPAHLVPKADNATVLKEMGITSASASANRSPFMHRTKSIDYAIVLSGEIAMLLDDSEVIVRAGDVLVQRGTNHAWENRGSAWCRIAFVLIDAEPLGDH